MDDATLPKEIRHQFEAISGLTYDASLYPWKPGHLHYTLILDILDAAGVWAGVNERGQIEFEGKLDLHLVDRLNAVLGLLDVGFVLVPRHHEDLNEKALDEGLLLYRYDAKHTQHWSRRAQFVIARQYLFDAGFVFKSGNSQKITFTGSGTAPLDKIGALGLPMDVSMPDQSTVVWSLT